MADLKKKLADAQKRIKELEDLLNAKDKDLKEANAKIDFIKSEYGLDDKDLDPKARKRGKGKFRLN